MTNTANPLGIHCVECTVEAPCGPCAGQVAAEAEWALRPIPGRSKGET